MPKLCKQCYKTKSLHLYDKSKQTCDGRTSLCRICVASNQLDEVAYKIAYREQRRDEPRVHSQPYSLEWKRKHPAANRERKRIIARQGLLNYRKKYGPLGDILRKFQDLETKRNKQRRKRNEKIRKKSQP